jgi:membrane protease subunit HflC
MSLGKIVLIIVLVLGGFLFVNSAYTVTENQSALVLRLGKVISVKQKPGLYFKTPFINNVLKFEKRLITHDTQPTAVLTGEKKEVLVDYFVKWRIVDAKAFYVAFRGGEQNAAFRLGEVIKSGLEVELGSRTIKDVVSADRTIIMDSLQRRANTEMSKYGMEVVDVRIKQIELPTGVKESVFKRMRTERERIAREHRANGKKIARIIKADADKKRVTIIANGRRKSEEIKGQGDAEATRIYARAYGGTNADFYAFYRSLEAYRNTFNSKNDILVLEPDSEFFRYFGSIRGK